MLGTTSAATPCFANTPLRKSEGTTTAAAVRSVFSTAANERSEEPLGVSSPVIEHRANARLVGGSKRGRREEMPGPAGVGHDVE